MAIPSDALLLRLFKDHPIKPFDCGDEKGDIDLNEFFLKDSKPDTRDLLTVTHIIETTSETIAFYSVLNDKISMDDGPSNRQWNKIQAEKFEEDQRYSSYPCVKIGRLGVNKNYQGKNIGKFIIDSIKQMFIDNNRTGCRFITVDAYNRERTLKFYEKNGFRYLPQKEEDPEATTKLMYFDLLTIINAKEAALVKPSTITTNLQ